MINFPTLSEALRARSESADSITFIEGKNDHRKLSYAGLHDRALMRLVDLREAGMQRGDQLIIFDKDNQRFVEAFWACIYGGIVPVPVAVGISDEHRAKLFRIFNKLERPYLFTTQEHLDRLSQFAGRHDMNESLQVLKRKTLLSNLLDEHDERAAIESVSPEEVAFIQFSSGSTSEPKGVVLTHRNIMTNLNAIATGARYSPQDLSLSWMPLTHDMGLLGFHLNMIGVGMSQCLMPTDLFSRRPLLWLDKASELGATVLCSPNFGYKHYLKALGDKSPPGLDLSRVRLIYNGAEPISVELCEQFLETLAPYGLKHQSMFTVYGLAEATLAVAFPELGESFRSVYLDRHAMRLGDAVRELDRGHPDAAGFAIEGAPVKDMEVRITDEQNATLGAKCIGLVQIRGPSVTAGYYQDEETNATALTGEGWLNTGDLGFINEAGELVITGRHKDIIFAHGQNYFPHDIEAVALQLPELELGKVVAYGLRQPKAESDELLMFVLFRADLTDFVGIARDLARHVNEQTGLEVSHVIPVKRIPKTTSGKLQRRLLGDAYLNGEFDTELKDLQRLVEAGQVEDASGFGATENKLKALCDEVVNDKSIGVHENLFESGISSLTLTEIHQRIDDEYPGLVDITDMFEHQTLAEIANLIDSKR